MTNSYLYRFYLDIANQVLRCTILLVFQYQLTSILGQRPVMVLNRCHYQLQARVHRLHPTKLRAAIALAELAQHPSTEQGYDG